ncbi:hypothetical protein C0991_000708, partial [Blastosporella zonata]
TLQDPTPTSLPQEPLTPQPATTTPDLQQRVIRNSRVVKFNYLKSDVTAPSDHLPNGLAKLCKHINDTLARIDIEDTANDLDSFQSLPPRTYVRGITTMEKGAFVLELDTPKLASCLTKYTKNNAYSFPCNILGTSATIGDKAHFVIAKFVPCNRAFDPHDDNDLRQIKYDNFLPD